MKNKVDKTTDVTQWILLRGLTRETRHWGLLPSLIEKGIPGSRVYGLDLPGAGRYSEMRSPVSIPEMTAFAREKYLELLVRQREEGVEPASETHLVSISLGGMVATDWLSRWPNDFTSCVLINTSFKGFSPIHHRLSLGSYRHLLGAIASRDSRDRERHVLRMVSNRPELHDEASRDWEKIQLSRPVSLENFARQLLAAARFAPNLRAPPVPVLLLNSLEDRMVNPSCSRRIADRWNADLRCHPSAGHDLPLDAPEWVVEQLFDWWKKLKGSPNDKEPTVPGFGS